MSPRGFNFEKDTEDRLAVLPNSAAAAKILGYDSVSHVAIKTLIVYHGAFEHIRIGVAESTYWSAIFVEAMMAYRGLGRGAPNGIIFDDVAMLALRGYVGEQVWSEAVDKDGSKHPFIRALLAGAGKEVRVVPIWK